MIELEYYGFLFTAVILFITNVGGLGGGGVLIPVSQGFFKFEAKNAIALSNFTIFISGLVRYFMNLDKMHPLKPWSVIIDYDYVVILLPAAMIGAQIGVMINIVTPSLIIIILLELFILMLQIYLLYRFVLIFRSENRAFAASKLRAEQEKQKQQSEVELQPVKDQD